MRIAMIGQKGIPASSGGVERHVHDLATSLVKEGHTVTVYARRWYTQTTPDTVEGVRMIYLPSLHTKHLDAITHTFLATLHAMIEKTDIIHYHGVGPALLAWIPRVFAPRIKVVGTFHSTDRKHRKWGPFARFMLQRGEWAICRFVHELITVSPTIAQYARDVYDRQSTYIPNAVPERTTTPSADLLAPWHLTPDSYILMVSRLIPHKGAHYLVEAYNQLQKKYPELTEHLPLVIVGDGSYTDAYLKELDGRINGNSHIIRTGAQTGETLQALFAHARIAVHPSDNEGLPITVLEAMSYGRPVLVSDIPEHCYLIPHTAWHFRQGDITHLEEKLRDVLTLSDTERTRMGAENKAIIARGFTLNTLVKKTEELYERLYSSTPEHTARPVET